MVSLCELLLASTIFLNYGLSAPTQPLGRQCSSQESERIIRSIPPNDCLLDEKDGQQFVFCTVRFAVEPPLDEDGNTVREDTDEDDDERKNLTIFMDYRLKLRLHDATESGVYCLQVISVNFDKLMKIGEERRISMTMPSSVFSVVANTQMFMSKTDIQQRPYFGRMVTDSDYWKNREANSSCIHSITFTSNAMQPGNEDEIHRGLFDYSIFGFGYSRISATSGETINSLFRETTRRGRVLLKHLPGDNLTELRLPNNRWRSLNDSYFPGLLPNVEIIDLSGNNFGEYETKIIGSNGILKVVNFSDSHLKKLPSFIERQNGLYILDIGGNEFDYMDGAEYLNQFGANMTNMRFLNIPGFPTSIFDQNTLPKWIYLEKLDASKCKILSIRKGAFDNLVALKWLDLSSNIFYTLEPTLFSKLTNLEYLDLSHNKLIEGLRLQFYKHPKWPVKGMQILNLSKTSMGTVAELLAEESRVTKIDLSDNVLRDLDELPGIWKKQWVIELDLSSNLISSLSKDVCERLSHVRKINLQNNIFDCSSCDMPDFKMWLNTTNQLTSEPELFLCIGPAAALENQTSVLNALNYIDPCRGPDYGLWVCSSMSGIALLVYLLRRIFYTYRFEASYVIHMIRVRSRVAKGEGKPHSECIYDAFVSYSGRDRQWVLRVLQPALEECDQKYQLCLHDRNFSLGGIITQNIVDSIDKSRKTLLILTENFVKSQIIGSNGILKVVNFSDSHLKKLPSFIERQNGLYILDIGGNEFDYMDGAEYLNQFGANMTNMRFLNIPGFPTSIFDQNTLPKWIYLEKLDASKCKILSIRKGAFDNLVALKWLDLSSNIFYTLEPTLFSKLTNLEYLDLSHNKLIEGLRLQFYKHPKWPVKGMQILNLSKTSMGTVAEMLAEESRVTKIDLSDNVLRDLDELPGIWKKQWVIELDLSSNLISSLSKDVCERLSHVRKINLQNNIFDCSSCDMPDFKMWLNTTNQLTSEPELFLCIGPAAALENQTSVLNALNYIDPCRGPDYGLWVCSSMSGIALLVYLLRRIFYTYRFEASYVIHMIRVRSRVAKGEGKPHSECIYDAFVSYSGRDRQWVLRVLQPALEECDQKYQLCLHDRNFSLGGIITQNIVDSIDKSRKTLLILTENFVKSQWCRWEMEMANHKLFNDSRNFLILIELDRLDRKMLPRHLRFLMETRTYLEWPENSGFPKNEFEAETSLTENVEYQGKSAEQDFWRRLHEALGDSLHVKERKAMREAEIAIQKTRLREADMPLTAEEKYQHHKEN